MRNHRDLDADLADRILDGDVDADDAPAALAGVTRLVARASTTAPAAGNDQLIAAMTSAITSSPSSVTAHRRNRKPMLAQILTAKFAAAAFTVAVGATGAAAATGTLPDAAQDRIASAAERIGVDLPDSASEKAKAARAAVEGTEPGAERGKAVSDAVRGDAGEDADDAGSAGDGKARAEDGKANADADRPATAPVATPNSGGTGTSSGASGGESDAGTDTAADETDAATDGSANAERAPAPEERPAAPAGRP